METKHLGLSDCGIKFLGDSATTLAFEGYASVFNGVDSYGDTIAPGAYAKTLKGRERPIRMRWNHWGDVIGKWLTAQEDEKGLHVTGELTPGHSKAADVYASMKHGAVSGLSIGYLPVKFEELGEGKTLLKEIQLVEISVVEEPADLSAQIGSVKSAIREASGIKEIESILRDAGGFSRGDACALISRIKALAHGDRAAELEVSEIEALFQRFTQ